MDELEKYYQYLKSKGADVPPTVESFRNTLSDEKSARTYFDYVKKQGYDAPDTYESFANTFGLKKKERGGTPSSNGSPTSAPSISPLELQKRSNPFPSIDSEVTSTPEDDAFSNDLITKNPIDLAKQYRELKDKNIASVGGEDNVRTGGGGMDDKLMPDTKSRDNADVIKSMLKDDGYDADEINKTFSDFNPDWHNVQGFSKKELAQNIKDNPTQAQRKIASAKWQLPLIQGLHDEGKDVGHLNNLVAQAQTQDTDYETKRQSNREIYNTIATSDLPNKDKLLKNFAIDHAYAYGTVDKNNKVLQKELEQYKSINPLINENHILALDYLKDVAPEKAAGFDAALVEPKELKDNFAAQMGQEEKLKRLEEIGISLQQNARHEKLAGLNNTYTKLVDISHERELTPDEQAMAADIEKYRSPLQFDYNMLNTDKNDLLTKYPKAGVHDAELFAQELLGQKHTGMNWLALESGKATEGAAQSIYDLVSAPFASEENDRMRQNEILGNEMSNETSTHLTQENQTTKTFTPTIKAGSGLEKYVEGIKNDTTLSDQHKKDAVTLALMRSPNEWQRTPIAGGKSNIGLSSLLYGTGSLAANLAPFVLMETATGGTATASFARKFTSNFASVLGTSYHQEVANNIDKGVADPYTQAAISTGINAIAMGGAQTATEIRKLASGMKNGIGDTITKLSDDEIMAALKKVPAPLSAFQKTIGFGKNILGAAKDGFKTAAKVQPLMTAGQIVNDANKGELKSFDDYKNQALIEGLKFGIMGTALGVVGRIGKDPNELNKAAMYQAGENPEPVLKALEQKVENNSITKDDAELVKNNIEKAAEVFKKVPFVDSKGRPMSERQRRDILFLKMQENELNETLKKDLPENLIVRTEKQVKDLGEKIDKVYKGKYEETIPEKPSSNIDEGNAQNQPAKAASDEGAAILGDWTPEEIKELTREKIDLENVEKQVEIPDIENYNSGEKEIPLKRVSAYEGRNELRKRLKSIDRIIDCITL